MCSNKTINSKQCTIIWHVDDLKISHVEKRVVDHVIDKLNKRFGEYSPLSTTTGKKLDYLGSAGLHNKRESHDINV